MVSGTKWSNVGSGCDLRLSQAAGGCDRCDHANDSQGHAYRSRADGHMCPLTCGYARQRKPQVGAPGGSSRTWEAESPRTLGGMLVVTAAVSL